MNSRQSAWRAEALPTELLPHKFFPLSFLHLYYSMIFGKNQEKGKDFWKKIFDFDFLFLSFIVDILYRIFGEKSNSGSGGGT